jgi:hypothetical protein
VGKCFTKNKKVQAEHIDVSSNHRLNIYNLSHPSISTNQ